jgi:hypothetical protein
MPILRACLLTIGAAALAAACARQPSPGAAGAAPAPAAEPQAPVASASELVERMRARYEGKWYRTMTFLQNNTLYKTGGGEEKSQWMEYLAVPGRLRIDYLSMGNRSGILVVDDTFYAFDNGRQVSAVKRIHPLLLLAADVYALPSAVTLRRLDSLGIDTARFRTAEWRGRPAYVVGAAPGDTTASQFWISADSLLVVRVIETRQAGARTVSTDYHFNRYTDVGGYPVAVEVVMHRDGRPVFKEEYADVKVNVELPDALFDPARWSEKPAGP